MTYKDAITIVENHCVCFDDFNQILSLNPLKNLAKSFSDEEDLFESKQAERVREYCHRVKRVHVDNFTQEVNDALIYVDIMIDEQTISKAEIDGKPAVLYRINLPELEWWFDDAEKFQPFSVWIDITKIY